ncbi:DEAD/DEAH box helicase family protein [Reichenbachiella carrageenanivorans]|uniref:DEAD/DEAH box helicase family protein n=1 Tax=Reichenbachiella carrageenanivorans TaxID=2979869 RepID=A0ABY6D2F3_9BACT|nr:DEAD/DEAH box helicase family protein [Reichenbachiella carrageenanivorans]UXX80342.1 DEAD/DEAH box helicase family protein [Reichenbachiella carrageenanivorans]
MKLEAFPKHIQFKYEWRKYQKRVLDDLQEHLDDNHLHVIAPPGSGKTVLGLEAMLRLDKPTLILAPTIAIRNQWIQRFCELFLQSDQRPSWISNHIQSPGFVTVSTYQGLHAACSGEQELEDELDELEAKEHSKPRRVQKKKIENVIQSLKDIRLGTIVIDEAHHLKNEWWKSIIQIKEVLKPTVVGLTATPPYDVSYAEWNRYLTLNGPVDTEISVPELVKEGDLCPHQDYIQISEPSAVELAKLKSYRANIKGLFDSLSKDAVLLSHIANHSSVTNPKEEHEWIYNHMAYYSAFLVFLHHHQVSLTKYHFEITGNQKAQLPKLDLEWLAHLLDYYLNEFETEDPVSQQHQQQIIRQLKRGGALERKKIKLADDSKLDKVLTASIGKLASIQKITRFEQGVLKDDLRQVILGDFIRQEFLSDKVPITKLGVVPIFESLRRDSSINSKLGVLTGSLVILPASALSSFISFAAAFGHEDVKADPLAYDPNYLVVQLDAKLRQNLVYIVTQVFHAGHIQVLVGTKSLLGEGWDAPSINVLILASFVGSFVMSNQMRGRAIRTIRSNKEKTSNIWHLVCADPTDPSGGRDVDLLRRRFKGFVGLSEREYRTIENGLNRLELPSVLGSTTIGDLNQRMHRSAKERDLLRAQWHEAIQNGTTLVEEIKIPYKEITPYKKQKSLYLNKTVKWVLVELGVGVGFYMQDFVQQLPRMRQMLKTKDGLTTVVGLFFAGLFFFFGTRLVMAFKMYVKYRDISKDLHAISTALIQSLVETKHIHTPLDKLEIKTTVNEFGEVYSHLEGGTTFEKSLFINSLQELVAPVEDPRYLLIRKSLFFRFIRQQDYHAVPSVLGKLKSTANILASHWKRVVGKCELIFAKNMTGRKTLLKARFHSLASEFQEEAERTNRWK